MSRTYVDSTEGASDYDFGHAVYFAVCGYCGWNGPDREERRRAERDRWRHPGLLCWETLLSLMPPYSRELVEAHVAALTEQNQAKDEAVARSIAARPGRGRNERLAMP